MIKIILAVDKNNSIGFSNGELAYKIKNDLQRFKKLTINSTVVMGKNTFLSLNKYNGLPERKNIILSTSFKSDNENLIIYNNLYDLQKNHNEHNNDFWVIGGAQIYEQFFPIADEIFLTQIHDINNKADVKLATNIYNYNKFIEYEKYNGKYWVADNKEDLQENNLSYSFIHLKKIAQIWKN